MEKLNLILSIFLIELIVDILVLKTFKIYYKRIYLLFLQIPKVCASVVCLHFYKLIWVCVLFKFLAMFICVLFITDSFHIKKIINLCLAETILLFSIAGFIVFVLLWINASIELLFFEKIPQNYQILLLFGILLYIFAIFKLVRCGEKNKFFKSFLTKVSLNLNGKHIYLYGLIDSGNSLFDSLTRKPIVLISLKSLQKNFSKDEIDNLLKTRSRCIKCDTISGSGLEIPLFKVNNFEIIADCECKKVNCMIGIVNHEFERGKFDCLLHRDFL